MYDTEFPDTRFIEHPTDAALTALAALAFGLALLCGATYAVIRRYS